jgi:hypothetical protein
MHPISLDESLSHSNRAAVCAIWSCGPPNNRSNSVGVCAVAKAPPINRSAIAPKNRGNAVSPYPYHCYGTGSSSLSTTSKNLQGLNSLLPNWAAIGRRLRQHYLLDQPLPSRLAKLLREFENAAQRDFPGATAPGLESARRR